MKKAPTFEEAMDDIERREQAEAKRRAKEPELSFKLAARRSGFTVKQANFMWTMLSKIGHEHWNGMVGI